jgi:CRP-like cAMP-binding protein
MDALTFLSEHVALFAGVSTDALSELAVDSTLRQLAPGQVILRAGMTVDGLYVVATGKVEVHAKVQNKGVIRIAELGPGEVFGETSIVDKTVAGATVKAGEAGAVILLVPEAAFHRLVDQDLEFAARVRTLIMTRASAPPKA